MLRNPVIMLGNTQVQTIGDPHLGRKFNSAHPEHRPMLEEKQWDVFKSLLTNEYPVKIIMGDIFDKAKVDEAVILKTAEIIKAKTGRLFLLEGNHDSSKTALEKTSFDVLVELLADEVGIIIIRGVETFCIGSLNVSMIGWEYHRNIREQIIDYLPCDSDYVFMHVDYESFSQSLDNCVPFDLLKEKNVKCVVNGHEHLPKQTTIEGIEYIGTGSLIPFDRSQQSADDSGTYADLFVTIKEGDDLFDLFVEDKIVYFEYENPDDIPEIKCLGLVLKKQKSETEDVVLVEVGDLSIAALLQKAGEQTGLSQDIIEDLIVELNEAESED